MSNTGGEKAGGKKAAGLLALKSPAVIAGVCAAVLVAGGGILYATGVIGGSQEEDELPGMQYAKEGVMLLDNTGVYDVLEPNAIALEFKNDAYSYDGKTFSCYLGNSALNEYDMFIALYTDTSFEEQLYMSGLVPPGSGLAEITLNRELEVGTHRLTVAFTQMEDPKTIHAQTLYTMDFHVLTEK